VLAPIFARRVDGWRDILQRLGDAEVGKKPRLFIHKRCKRLIECLPSLQNDPGDPEDILKINMDESGFGGDDAADALRYLLSPPSQVVRVRLRGL